MADIAPAEIARILGGITDAFVALDASWRYTYVNERAGKIFGRRPEDLVGKHIWTEFPEGVGQPFHLAYERAARDQVPLQIEEYYPPYDRWFENRIYPHANGISILFHDVSDRKRTELLVQGHNAVLEKISSNAPLRESLDLLARTMDAAAPGNVSSILLLDPDGQHVRHAAGPGLPEAYTRAIDGAPIGPAVGSCGTAAYRREPVFVADIATDPLWTDYRDLALAHGLRACWSTPILAVDGGVLGTFAIYRREPSGPAPHHLAIIERATHLARIAIEAERARALQAQFLQAQKMEIVGRLAAGVAHDFNNLLSIILCYSELLLARLPAADRRRGDVDEILKAGVQASALTRQLLAFSRQQVVELRTLDLNAVVSDLERMLRRLIGATVRLELAPAADLGRVRLDAGRVEQVILNLCVNARDAMPDGGTIVLATANADLASGAPGIRGPVKPGPYVKVSVRDTGTGISDEVLAHLFEPFFTTKEPGKGTGLGLSTVLGIVQAAGGHVGVESAVGQGTTFSVYFPRVEAAATATDGQKDAAPVAGSETIVVVEDDQSVRELVRRLLEREGYQVIAAPSGPAALRACEGRSRIDLLLTDVNMADMSGHQVAEHLTEARPGLRTLYLSGYASEVVRNDLARGAFVAKPFTPRVLLAKVREVLDAPRA